MPRCVARPPRRTRGCGCAAPERAHAPVPLPCAGLWRALRRRCACAQYFAGMAVLLVVFVAVALELTVRDAVAARRAALKPFASLAARSIPARASQDGESAAAAGWSLTKAASSAGMSLLSSRAAAVAPALQEACTCQHAEAGLRAALASCGKCGGSSAELVQALTVQARPFSAARGAREARASLLTAMPLLPPPCPADGCAGGGAVRAGGAAARGGGGARRCAAQSRRHRR